MQRNFHCIVCASNDSFILCVFRMSYTPPPHSHHDLGLLDEVLLQHGALSDGLDGHLVLSPPLAEPHLAEVAAAQLLHEGQLAGIDLPLVCTAEAQR